MKEDVQMSVRYRDSNEQGHSYNIKQFCKNENNYYLVKHNV